MCLPTKADASNIERDRGDNTCGNGRVVALVGKRDSSLVPFHDEGEAGGEKQNSGEDRDVENQMQFLNQRLLLVRYPVLSRETAPFVPRAWDSRASRA